MEFYSFVSSYYSATRRMEINEFPSNIPISFSYIQSRRSIYYNIYITSYSFYYIFSKENTYSKCNTRTGSTRSEPEIDDLFFCQNISHISFYFFHENVRNSIVNFTHQYSIFELYNFANFCYTFLIKISYKSTYK